MKLSKAIEKRLDAAIMGEALLSVTNIERLAAQDYSEYERAKALQLAADYLREQSDFFLLGNDDDDDETRQELDARRVLALTLIDDLRSRARKLARNSSERSFTESDFTGAMSRAMEQDRAWRRHKLLSLLDKVRNAARPSEIRQAFNDVCIEALVPDNLLPLARECKRRATTAKAITVIMRSLDGLDD